MHALRGVQLGLEKGITDIPEGTVVQLRRRVRSKFVAVEWSGRKALVFSEDFYVRTEPQTENV